MKPQFQRCVRASALVLMACVVASVCLAAEQPDRIRREPAVPPAAIRTRIEKAATSAQPGTAEPLLEEALKRYPDWREGWWQLGSLAYEQNEYLEGRIAFSTLAKLDSRAGATWVMLGLCDFELRDFGLSLLHIEKGRALGFPKNPQLSDVARYHQALDLIVVEEFEQASYLLDSFAREGHRSPEIILAEGLAALRIPAIGPSYQRTVDAAQLNLVEKVGEAQYAAANKEPDRARAIYQELVEKYPRAAGLHYAYGAQLARWGSTGQALKQFQAELQMYPDHSSARLESAYLLYRMGRLDDALPEARAAIRLLPASFASHFVLGQILIGQGHLQEGALELEQSRNLQPDSSQVRYALAQVYLRLHRRDDARKEQEAFRRLRPIEASMIQKGTLPASVFEESNTTAPAGMKETKP